MIVADALERGAEALGLTLGEAQYAQLERYLDLLEKWNRVYNLTAIRERDRMVTHHLLDSLAVLPYVQGTRMVDIGSGAGLPGIPIAVARPSLSVVLLESNQKKAAFLRQASAELRLENIAIDTERVEAWRPPKLFDTIISRAFAELGEFVAASAHLLAPGGVWLAMKGAAPSDEIEQLPPAYRVLEVIKLTIPQLDAARHLVMVGPA
jgi:16S rRNA (guanine527-N7)-methyltransferase